MTANSRQTLNTIAAVALLIWLGGCSFSPVPSKYQEWQACRREFDSVLRKNHDPAQTDPAIYDNHYNSLMKIDVTNCPNDYQQAWSDYLGFEKEWCDYMKARSGAVNFWIKAATVAATAGATLVADVVQLADFSTRRESLEGRLKALATKYGHTSG